MGLTSSYWYYSSLIVYSSVTHPRRRSRAQWRVEFVSLPEQALPTFPPLQQRGKKSISFESPSNALTSRRHVNSLKRQVCPYLDCPLVILAKPSLLPHCKGQGSPLKAYGTGGRSRITKRNGQAYLTPLTQWSSLVNSKHSKSLTGSPITTHMLP